MSRSGCSRTAHFLFVRFAWWILQTSEITPIRISIIPMMTFASKEICITPGKEISREAIYTPPFRLRGMTGNRPYRWDSASLLYHMAYELSITYAFRTMYCVLFFEITLLRPAGSFFMLGRRCSPCLFTGVVLFLTESRLKNTD